MAEQTKNLILKLKLETDVSSGTVITKLIKEQVDKVGELSASTEKLVKIDNSRNALLQSQIDKIRAADVAIKTYLEKQAQPLIDLQARITKANETIAAQGRGWNFVEKSIIAAVNNHNKYQLALDKEVATKLESLNLAKQIAQQEILKIQAVDRNRAMGEKATPADMAIVDKAAKAVNERQIAYAKERITLVRSLEDAALVVMVASEDKARKLLLAQHGEYQNRIAMFAKENALEEASNFTRVKAWLQERNTIEREGLVLGAAYTAEVAKRVSEGQQAIALRRQQSALMSQEVSASITMTELRNSREAAGYNAFKTHLADMRIAATLQAAITAETIATANATAIARRGMSLTGASTGTTPAASGIATGASFSYGTGRTTDTSANNLAILRNFNEATARIEQEAENRRRFHLTAETNAARIATAAQETMYRTMFDRIEARASSFGTRMASGSAGSSMIGGMTAAARLNVPSTASNIPTIPSVPEEVINSHRNLFIRVGEAIGAYRIWNTAINAVTNSLHAIPRIGIELESTIASLTATTGSAAGMGSVMAALKQEADRTGISITTLRETFRGFQASTSLAGESMASTWHMFTNLNTVITGLHLPSEKASGIFLAMAQIFNKTKVQSEELVKQLGNLLPGAFASFAAANKDMFKNSAELIAAMKKGTVFAHDTVEKFTQYLADRFAPAFALASQGLNSNIGRMQTSFTLLGEAIYNSTSGPLLAATKAITVFANYMKDAVGGTNNFGSIVSNVLQVALVALTAATIKSINTSIINIATKIGEARAIASVGVSAVGTMTALTGVTRATVVMTTSTGLATIASNLFAKSMLFLASPVGIVAGLGIIAVGLNSLYTSFTSASERAKEFIRKTTENLDSIIVKPITLELAISSDPAVKEAQKNIDGLLEDIEIKKARLARRGSFITNILNKYELANDKKELETLLPLLQKLQDKAAITLTVETGGALKDIVEATEKMHILALQAQGLDIEAGKLQFNITHKSDIVEAQKLVDELDKAVKIKKQLSIADTLGGVRSTVTVEVDSSIKEIDKLRAAVKDRPIDDVSVLSDETFNGIATKIANYESAKNRLSYAAIAEGAAGIKKQLAHEKDYASKSLQIEEGKYAAKATLDQVAKRAEFDAKDKALGLSEVLNERERQLKAQDQSPEVLAKLRTIGEQRVDIETGISVAIQKAKDEFNKKSMSSVKIAGAEERRERRDLYKDIIRDSKDATLAIEADLLNLQYARQDELISVKEYYDKRKALQDKDYQQQQAATARLLAIAMQGGTAGDISKYSDRIKEQEQAQVKLEAVNLRSYIVDSRAEVLRQISNKTLEQTNRLTVEQNELSSKYLSGLINESSYITQTTLLKLKDIEITKEKNKALEAQLLLLDKFPIGSEARRGLEQDILTGQASIASKSAPSGLSRDIGTRFGSSSLGMSAANAIKLSSEQSSLTSDKALSYAGLPSDPSKLSLEAHRKYTEDKNKIDEDYTTKSRLLNLDYYAGVAGMAATAAESITSTAIKVYGAQSKQAKIAFIAYKALKVAEIMMDTASLATRLALSAATVPVIGAALAAAAVPVAYALGAVQIGMVMAAPMPAAHGGMTNVPSEQTYLLDKGERVLSPNQNKDFTNFLKENKKGSGQTGGNVYNVAVTVQATKDQNPADLGNTISMSIMRGIAKEEIATASRPGNSLNKTTSFG